MSSPFWFKVVTSMRTDFKVFIKESRVFSTLEMRKDDSFWDWLLAAWRSPPHSKCLLKHLILSKKKFWNLERKEWRTLWEIRWGFYKGKVWMQTLGLFLGSFILPVFETICLMFLKPYFNKDKVGQMRWLLELLPAPTDSAWGRGGGRCIESIGLNEENTKTSIMLIRQD